MKKYGKWIALFVTGCLLFCVGIFLMSCGNKNSEPDPQSSPAESIFYAYDGNHSAMGNDGVYDEYKSYNVSEEQEALWFKEIIEKKRNEMFYSEDGVDAKLAVCRMLRSLRQGKMYSSVFEYEYGELIRITMEYLSNSKIETLEDASKMTVYSEAYETLKYLSDTFDCTDYAFGLRYHLQKLQDESEDPDIRASAERLFNQTYDIGSEN